METRRKNIRLPLPLYENPSLIFSITICTKDRRPWFSNPNWAETVYQSLTESCFKDMTNLYARCLMLDHLHLLLSPRNGNLVKVIGSWKGYMSHLLGKVGFDGPCWQRGFYDHVLRSEEDVPTTARYIVNNPVRKGLVDNWWDYPYSWHKWM